MVFFPTRSRTGCPSEDEGEGEGEGEEEEEEEEGTVEIALEVEGEPSAGFPGVASDRFPSREVASRMRVLTSVVEASRSRVA